MVVQKEIDLNKPLDANAAPVLAKTTLKPELSKAAIVLHGDRYKQLQAKLYDSTSSSCWVCLVGLY